MAAAFFGELWRQLLLLLLVLVELYFDEFVAFQLMVQRGEEFGAEAFLANLERGFHSLSPGLESADLGVGEWNHLLHESLGWSRLL